MDNSEDNVDQQTLTATLDAVQKEFEFIKMERELKLELEDTNTELKILEVQSKELNLESEAKIFEKDNKIKTLETELLEANEQIEYPNLIQDGLFKVNEVNVERLTKEETRVAELELSCKKAEIAHMAEMHQITTLITKMPVLFENSAEIEQQIGHCQEISPEYFKNLNKIVIKFQPVYGNAIKNLEETVCDKDTEISALENKIIALECKDYSTDFKLPANVTIRKRGKENILKEL